MNTVELAVKRVKKLSPRQARALLVWLNAKKTVTSGEPRKKRRQPWWRRGTRQQRMKRLRDWEDSVRLTTDWEPPRMPDEFIKPFKL